MAATLASSANAEKLIVDNEITNAKNFVLIFKFPYKLDWLQIMTQANELITPLFDPAQNNPAPKKKPPEGGFSDFWQAEGDESGACVVMLFGSLRPVLL